MWLPEAVYAERRILPVYVDIDQLSSKEITVNSCILRLVFK
jgi:TPP-dependent trihydroxycyclohexane-1,2-dione (THcHDO) dehydratase